MRMVKVVDESEQGFREIPAANFHPMKHRRYVPAPSAEPARGEAQAHPLAECPGSSPEEIAKLAAAGLDSIKALAAAKHGDLAKIVGPTRSGVLRSWAKERPE